MALDWILRNARIAGAGAGAAPDAPPVDIGIGDGRIAALERGLKGDAQALELGGRLVSPGLIETHIHLDKSRILDRCTPSPNRGRDHMQRVSAVKPGFTVEDVYRRARTTAEQCISHGTTHMRTHVEVDPNVGLTGFEALRQLRQDCRWALELELCVFAQEGQTNVPETDANLVECLKRGATVIGGAPGYDPDRAGQIRRIFELSREFDVDVDIHLDVGHETDELDILLVCELTEQHKLGGRVAIGHGTKYSCLPPEQLARLGRRIADAGVTVTVLPATDLYVMGRHQEHSVLRGVADANALGAYGVNCCLSTNNVLNPFTPFGDGNLLRIANLYANVAQRGMNEELAECFDMLTSHPARLLGLEQHRLAVGAPADLVVWDATTPAEAVATIAPALYGFKGGRLTFTRQAVELHRP